MLHCTFFQEEKQIAIHGLNFLHSKGFTSLEFDVNSLQILIFFTMAKSSTQNGPEPCCWVQKGGIFSWVFFGMGSGGDVTVRCKGEGVVNTQPVPETTFGRV